MRWGVALCSCNETLRLDPGRVAAALPGDLGLAGFARLPKDEIHRFVDWAARERADRVLVACCGAPALFREALAAAGADPAAAVVVNLREQGVLPRDPASALEAAVARLLRATMRGAEAGRSGSERPLRVGPTVLVATDGPAGLRLARRLESLARPVVVLDEGSTAFDAEPPASVSWKTTWGRVARIDGSLGAFRVAIERTQPLSLEACIRCRRCVPVCHTSAISEGLRLRTELCDRCGDCLTACGSIEAIRIPRQERETLRADQVVVLSAAAPAAGPRRTGHHAARSTDPAAVDALAWDVLGLIGEFTRTEPVAYASETCAGGAAGHQSCGRCIGACPYGAIARDPRNLLRVSVDQAACEGCGACVAECPPSALTFTDPPPDQLRARMAALLAPLRGEPDPTRLVALFHCPERGQALLAAAGRLGLPAPPGLLPIPMACLRHVSEGDVLGALRLGAAGVALLGCADCPHGPRPLLLERLDRVRAVLDAFGAGPERVALIAGDGTDPRAAIGALDAFTAALGPAPIRWDGDATLPAAGREAIAEAIRALLDATRREPGRLAVPADAPFASPRVDPAKCTLARACVNACPTHAWRFDEARQALLLRSIACVNCGLCVQVCPEGAITLDPAIPLEAGALEWRVAVQDEPAACTKCGKPFGNRRAVQAVEARLRALPAVVDVFAGPRAELLRMCPECRAVAAMLEVHKGWEP
jgi:ferredoxin